MKPFCVSACLDGMRKDATHPHIEVNTHAMLYTFISLSSFFLIMIQTQFDYFFFVFSFFFIYHQISSSFQSHYFHLARCINLPALALPASLPPLSSYAPVWSELAASGERVIRSFRKRRRGKRHNSQHLYGVHRQWWVPT